MLTFIVNPKAGSGLALRVETMLRQALERKGVRYQLLRTERAGHATELAQKVAAQADCTGVVSVGGDGTAYEVAWGLLDSGVPLGIIPAGTGNDFIKTVQTPAKPLDALDFILTHPARPVDVGRLNDRLFLNVCGTGFDVQVLDGTLAAKKYVRGILPYLLGLFRAIFQYKPVHVSLAVDDRTMEQDALVCSIANGRYIGGGIPICPEAKPDDGFLDLVIVENRPKRLIPLYLPGLLMGRVLRFKITSHVRCKRIRLVSPGMRLNVDGEIFPMDEAEFAAMPGKLLLYW